MTTPERPAFDKFSPAPSLAAGPGRRAWAVLAIALASTIVMWVIAYIALMQPGRLMGEFLFGAMLSCLACGGFVGGQYAGGGWRTGALVGLVAACFNLLIVGALLGDVSQEGFAGKAALWALGSLAAGAALGALGGWIGGRMAYSPHGLPINWYGVFTKAVVVAAFVLLLTGGIVTGWEVGLAVPDWPNSFGHNMILYPLTQMTSEESMRAGVHYEHAHRLYGMLVGLSTVLLAITVWFADGRKWLGLLAILALLLVSTQGLLGGLRVNETSNLLALVHGVLGQIVVALLVSIAAFTSDTWRRGGAMSHPSAATERRLGAMLVGALLVQLTLGATYRHFSGKPDVSQGMITGMLHTHVLVAVLILVLIVFMGLRAGAHYRAQPAVRRAGKSLMHVVGVQVALGIAAFVAVLTREPTDSIPAWEVIVTTVHQVTGAAMLALATLHAIWTRRLLALPPA